jgi:hypothetical protein
VSGVFELLSQPTDERDHDVPTRWVRSIADSMSREPDRWTAAVDELDDGRSWRLLGFVELAASLVGREGSLRLAEQAAFALALLQGGPLDRRDVIVVADLLPRACDRAGLDFAAAVRAGCARAGERGESCREWLLQRPVGASLYDEVGEGRTFRYRRVPAGFDADDLLDRLKRHRKDR